MTEDEKRGFKNGCRVMLQMVDGCADIIKIRGTINLANALYALTNRVGQSVDILTEQYSLYGYETIMKHLGYKKKDEKRCSKS